MDCFIVSLGVTDYQDVLDAISSKKYTAGLINTDVAWYYQDALRDRNEPLRIVKRLNKDQPVMVFMPKEMPQETREKFEKCYSETMKMYTVHMPVHKHRGYIKVCREANYIHQF